MTQQEAYKILKKYPNRWFTVKEIKFMLNRSSGSLSNIMRKLSKQGFAFRREVKANRPTYEYKFCH